MRKVLRKNQYCMAPIKPCLNLGAHLGPPSWGMRYGPDKPFLNLGVHLGDVVRNPLHINLAWL